MRDLAHERRRHRRNARQQDAEDGAGRLYVGIGAVRRQRRAPKARTRSSKRCDFMRGSAIRARSSESIQVFSNRG